MLFIKQCKGKDLDKVPVSKLDKGLYWASRKYDGNYVQIHKIRDEVIFFSSGGIRFYLEDVANEIVRLNPMSEFVLEAEYIADTDGMLGSRGKCSTTTFRTNTKKGIENRGHFDKHFKVFDLLYYKHDYMRTAIYPSVQTFEERKSHFIAIHLPINMEFVEHTLLDFDYVTARAENYVNKGGEGYVGVKAKHIQRPGKRVNDRIKFKFYPTVMMRVINATFGTGQYHDVISSLLLSDDNGIRVNVGGVIIGELGITDENYFIGKDYKIEYESFKDTYIQPRFYKEMK